jgi:hypothetical protein
MKNGAERRIEMILDVQPTSVLTPASGSRDAMHCRNGEVLKCLVAALREGKVFIADAQGELVRLPADAWSAGSTVVDGNFVGLQGELAVVHDVEPQNSPQHHDPLTALEVAVLRLNHRQQLITGRPDEVVRNCRQIHDPIFLRRSPRNELEFAEFITAFARMVYDGTNGVANVADRGKLKPTLPWWCYRDERSVIAHVIALRNHYLHGLSPNETTAEEHLTSAGDVFELYVAKRLPDDDDFAAIRVGMLTAATRLVNRLAAHVPVRDAANADSVFENQNGEGRAEYLLSKTGTMSGQRSPGGQS